MKRLLTVIVAVITIIFAASHAAFAADSEGYTFGSPSMVTTMGGEVQLTKDISMNFSVLSSWLGIGTGTPNSLYTYFNFPVEGEVGGFSFAPGFGFANNLPGTQASGILNCNVFGGIGPFRSFTTAEVYLSQRGEINTFITSRWWTQPWKNIPLKVGAQLYAFNSHVSIAPDITFSPGGMDIAFQYVFGVWDNPTHSPRLVLRKYW